MRAGLIALLIVQLSWGPYAQALPENPPDVPAAGGLPLFVAGSPAPMVESRDLHIHQYHYIYSPTKDGTADQVVKKISLSEINIENPVVLVRDPAKELRFVFDSTQNTLLIQRTVYDEGLKRFRVTDAHAFEQFHVTSNIAVNSNEIFFAEAKGVRAILMKHLKNSFCSKPLVTPVVLPPGPDDTPITGIEFQSREIEPDPVVWGPVIDGDLRVQLSDGSVFIVKRSEVIRNLAVGLLGVLAQVQAANPDLAELKNYQKIFEQNAADLSTYVDMRERMLDGPYNDAVVYALRALGQKMRYEELGVLFEKDKNGRNAFDKLISAPRNVYSHESWTKSYRDILLSRAAGVDPTVAKLSAQAEDRFVHRVVTRIQDAFDRFATRKNLIITCGVLGAIAVNGVLANSPIHWMVAGITRILNWSTSVPVLGQVTDPIFKSLDFYSDPPSRWAIMRLAFGAALVWTMNPVSYGIAKMVSVVRGRGWSGVEAFFNYGTRAYGFLNYPLQKIVWEFLRQKNLYKALIGSNVDPFRHPKAFNFPFAEKKTIEARASQLNDELNSEAAVKGRASLLAAAIVSEMTHANGHPIDIATLLLATPGEQIGTFEYLMRDVRESKRWSDLTFRIYTGLVAIGDTGGRIDPSQLSGYISLYKKTAEELRGNQGENVQGRLRDLYRISKNMMSREILPFLLFGKQLYLVSQRYMRAGVHPQTAEIAKHMYNEDYRTSTYIYAATDPLKFADIAIGEIGAPEVITNQLSQVFIYGVQGAIDPPDPAEGMRNPFPAASDKISEKGHKQQTVGEGLKDLLRKAFDPNEPSYLGQHLSVIKKNIEGFQVRFAADYFTRTAAAFMILHLSSASRPAGEIALATAITTTYFLIAKIAFQIGQKGLIPGYATVWPYIQMAMRHNQNTVAENLNLLKRADYLMAVATESGDHADLVQAVDNLKSLYRQGRLSLPDSYLKPSSEYTREDLTALQNYRLLHPPLSTRISEPLAKWLNRIGAIASTALYTSVSAVAIDMAVNPAINPAYILGRTLVWFGLTAAGLAAAKVVTTPALRAGHFIVRSCRAYLGL
jgi:hypothetical protein